MSQTLMTKDVTTTNASLTDSGCNLALVLAAPCWFVTRSLPRHHPRHWTFVS